MDIKLEEMKTEQFRCRTRTGMKMKYIYFFLWMKNKDCLVVLFKEK